LEEGDEEDDDEDEEEDEDEDDEDEDDELDSDEDSDDEDEIEETSVICSLTAGKTEQAQVNLTLVEGEIVIFEVTGDK
jgi:FK506-binding nuclear protein